MTVVLVDDELLTGKALKKTLEFHEELQIKVAGIFTNGKEALKNIVVLQPDVAIVDIRMPIMDGLELMAQMKKNGLYTKVVVLSAYRDFDYAQKALHLGAYGYLTKPISDKKLLEMMAEIQKKISEEKDVYDLKLKLDKVNAEQKEKVIRELAEASVKEQDHQPDSELIQKVTRFCEENLEKDITLKTISDDIAMNKNYFCSFFKKNMGISFWSYLVKLRMEKAKELLCRTDYKANIIAEMVGYKNSSHFGKTFKEYTGRTPAEYRTLMSMEKNGLN